MRATSDFWNIRALRRGLRGRFTRSISPTSGSSYPDVYDANPRPDREPTKGARRRIGYLGAPLFPARFLAADLFGEPLARDVPDGLLIKPLGLHFFLASLTLRPRLVVAAGAVRHAQVGPKEVYGDGQDDGGVMLACDLAHRLEEP